MQEVIILEKLVLCVTSAAKEVIKQGLQHSYYAACSTMVHLQNKFGFIDYCHEMVLVLGKI